MNTKTCPACFTSIDARAIRCSACTARQPDAAVMHRNLPGKVLGGVCTALSLQLGWDPMVVRVLFVSSLVLTGPLGIWLYGLLWLVTPFEALGKTPVARAMDWAGGLFKMHPEPAAPSGPTDVV